MESVMKNYVLCMLLCLYISASLAAESVSYRGLRNIQSPVRSSLRGISLLSANGNSTRIQSIDTQCSQTGLTITVNFDGEFNGIIYSKGYFSDPRCRFVEANGGRRVVSFLVPANDCGTSNSDRTQSISNVLIFQMDETIQESQDVAKRISCSYSDDPSKHGKMVVFRPLSVGMLDIKHQPIKSDAIDCWMDIQKGIFPNTEPIAGQIGIGEELSILIYLKDEEKKYDVSVKDCWAFDSDNFEDPKVSKVQLTDYDGCPRKVKLIGRWQKTFETLDSGATTIAFTSLLAFKFPNSDSVHLTCNIELCRDACEETCLSNSGGLYPQLTTPAPRRPVDSTRRVTIKYGSTAPAVEVEEDIQPGGYTPAPSKEYQYLPTARRPYDPAPVPTKSTIGYYDKTTSKPYQPAPASSKPTIRYYDQTTPRPFDRVTVPVRQINQYEPTSTRKPICYPGTTDPRCSQPTTSPPLRTTSPVCYPGAVDPRCPAVCPSSDFRCPRPTTAVSQKIEDEEDIQPGGYVPTTTLKPYYSTRRTYEPVTYTTKAPTRYEPTTRRPNCYEGNTDPRCPKPTTSAPVRTTSSRCYPGAVDPRCPPVCPSSDFRCPRPTTATPVTTIKVESEEYIQPGGYISSEKPFVPTTRRPYEPVTYTTKATTRYEPTTRKPYVPVTVPSRATTAYDPTSRKPNCYFGSRDPACPQPTTSTPVRTTSSSCYFGSRDPACPQPTTSTPVRTTSSSCYFGSRDPACQQPTTSPPVRTTSSRCYPGAIDPRCPAVCPSSDFRCSRPTPPTTKIVENEEDIQPGGYTPSTAKSYEPTTRKPYEPVTVPSTATIRYEPTTQRPYQPVTVPTRATVRYEPTTQKPYESTKGTNSYEPTTRKPICYVGSTDPRCPQSTTSSPLRTTTTRCYPGAVDPRCPPVCPSSDFRCPRPTPGTTKIVEDEKDIQPGGYVPTTTVRPYYSTTRRPLEPVTYTTKATTRYEPVTYKTKATTRYEPVTYTTKATTRYEPVTYTTKATTKYEPVTYTTKATTKYEPTTRKPVCYPGSTDIRCPQSTTSPPLRATTTRCYPGAIDPRCPPVCPSSDFRCPRPTTKIVTNEEDIRPGGYVPTSTTKPYVSTTRRPYDPVTTRYEPTTRRPFEPVTVPSRATTRYEPTTRRPYEPVTVPSRATTRYEPTTRRPYEPVTVPSRATTRYEPTTRRPYEPVTVPNRATTRYEPTTRKPNCYFGSPDPACPQPTTAPPPPKTSTRCYPGAIDPRCPPVCPSSDFRCPRPTTKIVEKEYVPTSSAKPYVPTTRRPYEPLTVPSRATTRYEPTTRKPYEPVTVPSRATTRYEPTTRKANCYVGSRDPACPQPTTSPPARTTSALCYPGAVDPRCPPVCPSSDFRCPRPTKVENEENIQPGGYSPTTRRPYYSTSTTLRPYYEPVSKSTSRYEPVTQAPNCYFGSRDPRCPQPSSSPPVQTTSKIICYPGAIDPRCPAICPSTDFRCRKPVAERERTFGSSSSTTKRPCFPGSLDEGCLDF